MRSEASGVAIAAMPGAVPLRSVSPPGVPAEIAELPQSGPQRPIPLAEFDRGARLDTVRPDTALEADAEAALVDYPLAIDDDIDVVVVRGVATLTGSAGSGAESEIAAGVVRGIRGISGIENQIAVTPDGDSLMLPLGPVR